MKRLKRKVKIKLTMYTLFVMIYMSCVGQCQTNSENAKKKPHNFGCNSNKINSVWLQIMKQSYNVKPWLQLR